MTRFWSETRGFSDDLFSSLFQKQSICSASDAPSSKDQIHGVVSREKRVWWAKRAASTCFVILIYAYLPTAEVTRFVQMCVIFLRQFQKVRDNKPVPISVQFTFSLRLISFVSSRLAVAGRNWEKVIVKRASVFQVHCESTGRRFKRTLFRIATGTPALSEILDWNIVSEGAWGVGLWALVEPPSQPSLRKLTSVRTGR